MSWMDWRHGWEGSKEQPRTETASRIEEKKTKWQSNLAASRAGSCQRRICFLSYGRPFFGVRQFDCRFVPGSEQVIVLLSTVFREGYSKAVQVNESEVATFQ